MNQTLKHYKALLKRVQSNPLVRELDRQFLEIFHDVYEKAHNFQEVLLFRLKNSHTSVFRYLKDLAEFTCYMDPQVAQQEILPIIKYIEKLLTELRELKQAILRAMYEKSFNKGLEKVVQFLRFRRTSEHSRVQAYVEELAILMDRKPEQVIQMLELHGFSLHSLTNIHSKIDQMLREIFVKELSLVNNMGDSQSTTQVLEDLEWLEKQISNVESSEGEISELEISGIVEQWNRTNTKYVVRVQKVHRLANKLITCALQDQLLNGTSYDMCQHLRKKTDFRRAISLCSLSIIIWLTKRIHSWSLMNNVATEQNDREKCIKLSSLLALSANANMPKSLKLFMFYFQYELNVIGRKLNEVIQSQQIYQDEVTRILSERLAEFLKLRVYDLTKCLSPSLQLYGFCWNAFKKVGSQSFDMTLDQFVICCIYAGTLLKTAKSANFNSLLKAYYGIQVKQENVGRINSQTTIIDYYNSHIVKFIQRHQQHLRLFLDESEGVEIPRAQFMEALKICI